MENTIYRLHFPDSGNTYLAIKTKDQGIGDVFRIIHLIRVEPSSGMRIGETTWMDHLVNKRVEITEPNETELGEILLDIL